MTSSNTPLILPRRTHGFFSSIRGLQLREVFWAKKAELDQHAKDFLAKQAELPPNIVLVTDPDYTVTNLYGLRWNAFHETAYPSTFILDKKGMVVFEKISHSHDDRLSAQDALAHLSAN
jgi:thioredoxin-dependent peroxiredoxin